MSGLAESAIAEPAKWIRWTPPQQAFYALDARRKCLRGGNQALGKTTIGLRWVVDHCLGRHPNQVAIPPIDAWVVCTSWGQAVAIMGKFRALVPAEMVNGGASSNFTVKNGYGKDNPAVLFNNGSIVRFRTTNQGAVGMQGATVHIVLIDEPTDLGIYRELDRRLTTTGGRLAITFTPVNRDCTWIRELIKGGVLEEVHARLTVANVTPIGADEPLRTKAGELMNDAWIAEQWRITPKIYAPVVLDGEWDMAPGRAYFDCFDRSKHVSDRLAFNPRSGRIRYALGIDHAAADREDGQVAVLVKFQTNKDAKGRERESVIVVDEVFASGVATESTFAVAICAMLSRRGIAWGQLAHAYGDNPISKAGGVIKSNQRLHRALALECGVDRLRLSPRIDSAKEGRQSTDLLDAGCRYLYEGIADGHVIVHPRCAGLIKALQTWDFKARHPEKDKIDALRYAMRPYIFRRPGAAPRVQLG